ncbi:MAG: AbrB/MazE/SpoVT family DNA-binding domain-containing protein [Verrucomicrobia bacterium]|nr:AbrB/MazE/SpoVT family DNA-binding domain-containing protein [Verrucomicrobiota bacterium]
MDATVQADGKISVPKELRDALGLDTGTVMDLQQQAGALVARKKADPDVFEKWRGRGRLPGSVSTDEYLRLTRDGDRR